MKKKISCIAVLCVCLFAGGNYQGVNGKPTGLVDISTVSLVDEAEAYNPEGKVYAICDLNLRDSPGGKILRTLSAGSEIYVQENKDGWAKTYDGYCSANYLASQWNGNFKIHGTSQEKETYCGYIYDLYSDLPGDFTDIIADYEVILCDSKEINEKAGKENIAGLTITNSHEKQIWVTHEAKVKLKHVFYHECAHAIEHSLISLKNECPSNSDIFKSAFEEENDYFAVDGKEIPREEAFAEAFAFFLEKPDVLKKECPQIYKILKDFFQEPNIK